MPRRVLVTSLLLAACVVSVSHAQARRSTPPPVVVMSTSLGEVHLQLDPARAPKTVANFLKYVERKHYDGTIFHRVISDFMIQGGGFTREMREKPTLPPVAHEGNVGLKNRRGTLAMARTSDPDSATAQFFINVKDNAALDPPNPDGHGYVVFGKVIKGMNVVDRIRQVPTGTRNAKVLEAGEVPFEDVPIKPVTIRTMRVLKPARPSRSRR